MVLDVNMGDFGRFHWQNLLRRFALLFSHEVSIPPNAYY
jgi:hypothetical protein